ncbi:hypothetical protein GUJ93_ZPchr0004g40296 [Zizania palustris]|uniref:Amidohydrolase-related domain-containing protein n=1 Tax=Zizania palustris TaxID=103762 RepID=A0A8J5VYU5_ZIZPA|nr:hypothetical protein GUJ93_ZPchr0004g40296 [Zizania palustris]
MAAAAAACRFLCPSHSPSPIATTSLLSHSHSPAAAAATTRRRLLLSPATIAAAMAGSAAGKAAVVVDSHLHVWASPQQAAAEYPYFPGQQPSLRGDADFLLECMDEAGVDGALIVQPINHMFDHSLVTSVLKKYPSKFIGCCLANPADDGSGIKQLEHLIVQEKYRAVRFNPSLWPSGQKMTNEVGRSLFAKAGELGAPVGIMVMKVKHISLLQCVTMCKITCSVMHSQCPEFAFLYAYLHLSGSHLHHSGSAITQLTITMCNSSVSKQIDAQLNYSSPLRIQLVPPLTPQL